MNRRDRRASRLEKTARSRGRQARAHLARRRRERGAGMRAVGPPSAGLWLAAAFAVSLTAGVALAPSFRDLLASDARVAAISVHGNHRIDAREIAVATEVAPGSPFTRSGESEVEARLLAHPWVRSARVLWLPSGRLLVSIVEREPQAVLQVTGETTWHWVDEHGAAYAEAAAAELEDVPRLHTSAPLALGRPESQLLEAVDLARSARHLAPRFAAERPLHIEVPAGDSPHGWVLRSLDGAQSVILGRRELSGRLRTLDRVLAADSDDVRAAGQIDLRFANRAILRAARWGEPASG